MTKGRKEPPIESGAGADKTIRSSRWFSHDLQISLFDKGSRSGRGRQRQRQLRIPFFSKELVLSSKAKKTKAKSSQPRQLRVPLLSKDLIITFFGDSKAIGTRDKTFQPLHLRIPVLRPQVALSMLSVMVGLVLAYNFGRQARLPDLSVPASVSNVPAPALDPEPVHALGMPHSVPVKVRIPRIGVTASMEKLDKHADGTIAVPKSFRTVGWYVRSPTPGEIGPSVLIGHVDNVYGPAVFFYLKDLKRGDVIEVYRADKSIVKFKVDSLQEVSQDRKKFPTNKVYGGIDYAGLRLITCGGQFNNWTGAYPHNIVVFARMIKES